jgi:hypothetical protein
MAGPQLCQLGKQWLRRISKKWVLKAAVRNGILVYRPDPASGKLVELLPQPGPRNESWHWHQEVPSWLRDRLKWRDAEGVPTTADWKHISDLQVWDYFHLEDEKGCTEEELQPEILYAIAEDLELELQNSLSLRLHPSLRRAQIRRLEAAEYHSMMRK